MNLRLFALLTVVALGSASIHVADALAPTAAPTTRPTTAPTLPGATADVLKVPGVVAFWDFPEPPGEPRVSRVDPSHALVEMTGPVAREAIGPFGSALHVKPGQWLRVPREKLGALDRHGPAAQVSVVAWVKRERKENWQAVAGVWDESRRKRQFCLFLSAASKTDSRTMTRTPSRDLFQGHVSAVGGPTPGHEFCITYASSGTPVPFDGWQCMAMTYDGKEVRLYRNGALDAAEGSNPFPYADGLFDGGKDGADFTVGAVSVKGKPGNFFGGWIGGIAVFDRALTAEEVKGLPGMGKAP